MVLKIEWSLQALHIKKYLINAWVKVKVIWCAFVSAFRSQNALFEAENIK